MGKRMQENYDCTKCNKRYQHRQHLHRHLQYCSKNKIFKCENCAKVFQRKDTLDRHIRENCSLLKKRKNSSKKCKICGKAFSSLFNCSRHIEKVHNNEKKKFSCVRCGKVYATSAHYSNHICKCDKHVAVEAIFNSNQNDENDVEFSEDFGENEEAFEVIY